MRTDTLRNKVDLVNQMLEDLVRGEIIRPSTGEFRRYLTFAIARKWSSWYPTYFKTQGGCYAFITRDPTRESKENAGVMLKENAGVIVIDPGIRFGENLRQHFNVEPHDIRTVLVSHLHPDHTMGLYELLTLTHESHYYCNYYLNETAYEAFKAFQGEYNNILELSKIQVMKLADYQYRPGQRVSASAEGGLKEKICGRTLQTFHKEIGEKHKSLGFVFDISSGEITHRLVMLGDTDGNLKYHDTYLQHLKDADIAILHLGAFTEKGYGEGNRHLYKTGVLNILNCINCVKSSKVPVEEGKIKECLAAGKIKKNKEGNIVVARDSIPCKNHKDECFKNLKVVIVSELGLDVASMDHLVQSTKDLRWATKMYPLIFFSKFFNEEDEYIKHFNEKTSDIKNLSLEEKVRIHKTLIGTAAFDSIDELCSMRKWDYLQSVELYHSSVFLGLILCYLMLSRISEETWKTELKRSEIHSLTNQEKLKTILEKLQTLIETERLLAKKVTYDSFQSKERISEHEFIAQFGRILKNFLVKLLVSIHRVPPERALEMIEPLSKKIFDSTVDSHEEAMKSRRDAVFKQTNNRQFLSFVQSISMLDDDTLKMIRRLFELGFDFKPLAFLVSFELSRQIKSLKTVSELIGYINEARALAHTKERSVGEGLLSLLQDYSSGEQVNYLLSDLVMELNLSSRELQIRKDRGRWIPVSRAHQYFDSNGDLQLKHQREENE